MHQARPWLLAWLGLALGAFPATAAPEGGLVHHSLRFEGAQVEVLELPAHAPVRPAAEAIGGHTVLDWAHRAGALAAINGGYFNHSDGFPVSHVRLEGRALTAPERNRALTGNPTLRPFLPAIFNRRVEWRAISRPDGTLDWAIAAHEAPWPATGTPRHALQAGPRLLPTRDLAAEGFIARDTRGRVTRDGIGSTAPAARSALGLTADGRMLWVAVAGSDGHGRGLTLDGLARLMMHLQAREAMALDGGSSTSLAWRENGHWHSFVGTGRGAARVNSVLLLAAP